MPGDVNPGRFQIAVVPASANQISLNRKGRLAFPVGCKGFPGFTIKMGKALSIPVSEVEIIGGISSNPVKCITGIPCEINCTLS